MWIFALISLMTAEPPERAGPDPDISASVMRGQSLVVGRCSGCHAVARDDASSLPAAPPLRIIATRYPLDNLEEAFAEGIYVSHRGPMPPFVFQPDQIRDMLAYLRSLQTQTPELGAEVSWP